MNIRSIRTEQIKPYSKNAKKHDKKQIQAVANSIERFGWVQPLVVDKDDNLIIGHCRLDAAKMLGLSEVPVLKIENLTEEEVKALRLADNKLNESPWDMDLVIDELKDISPDLIDFTGFDRGLIAGITDEELDKYTKKINAPIYTPTGEKPLLEDLYDNKKALELLKEIESSDISEGEKDFLRWAAYRHCVLRFDKIANFYAYSSKEVQRLMEKSALVIIDFDKAIENGYIDLCKDLIEEYGD